MQRGRIVSNHLTKYKCLVENTVYSLEVSGRFKYMDLNKTEYPVTGDYVYFRETNPLEGIIERVEERKNTLSRLATSNVFNEQIIASNIDITFICISLNEDFHIRKVLNFLSLAKSDSYESILLFTKSDLTDNVEPYINEVCKYSDIEIIAVSSFNKEDTTKLKELVKDKTAVLVGSSGVGKSTLINNIIEKEHFKTNTIRETDAQGRHTTVHKELLPLDNGGFIIDSPGIRIVNSYYVEDINEEFSDIYEFSQECRFRDCKHEKEPGCRIKEALYNEELLEERYNQYQKALKFNKFARRQERIKEIIRNKKR